MKRSLPLANLRVWTSGSSAVGALTSHLLSSQGASIRTINHGDPEDPPITPNYGDSPNLPDVIIDATVRDASESTPSSLLCTRVADAMRRVGQGGVYVTFTGFPKGIPTNLGSVSESLINGVMGLELLTDEQADVGQLPVASAYAAALAAIEIMVSLRSAKSFTRLEVPLAGITFTLLGRSLVNSENPRLRDEMAGPRFPIADIYQCGDGSFIQIHGTTSRFSDGLCDALGHPEWRESARMGMKTLENEDAVEAWRTLIRDALEEFSAPEAVRRIVASGGSATICLTREEWFNSPQAWDSGIFERAKNNSGEVSEGASELGPGIVVREDTSSVFEAAERLPTETTTQTLPLEGIRVIDLSIVLAGPTTGRILAEWGADVIKVDSPSRPVSPYSWIDVNRSKRSVLIDLKTSEGKDVISDLIESADVVLENFRSGKLDALGFDYSTVSALKPGIIYASMNAFDYSGPMKRHPGWEHNAEALSGMQVARALDGRPKAVPYPVNDYLTGLLGAYGVMLALHQRDRTGKGARVHGSLARSATLVQFAHFASAETRVAASLPVTKCVRCRDGLVVADFSAQDSILAVETFRDEAIDLSTSEVLHRLQVLGLPSALSLDIETLVREDALSPFTMNWSQDSVGPVRQVFTPYYGDHKGFGLPRHVAPDPGSDTVAVLRALGYDDFKVNSLLENGAVASSQPLIR